MKRIIIVVCMAIFVLAGCGIEPSRTIEERLQDPGSIKLLGEHKLGGSEDHDRIFRYFHDAGTVDGDRGPEPGVRFCWSPKPGEYVTSVIPVSKLKIVIVDYKDVPTVEFVLNPDWLKERGRKGLSEKEYPNLNNFIMSWYYTKLIMVRISSKDAQDEIYLPRSVGK